MSSTRSRIALGLGWLGFLGHLAILVVYFASTLLAPRWAVIGLLIIWGAMTVFAWRQVRSNRPLWTLAIPIVDAAIWYAAISAGAEFLGWTG